MKAILIEDLGMVLRTINSKEKRPFAVYECPLCGDYFEADKRRIASGLKSSFCRSCSNSKNNKKHGGCGTKLYSVWNSMRQRCNNKKHSRYKRYGGRGISISNVWNDYSAFSEWALSSGYSEGLTLDRIDNDGNYEPSNCRWTTYVVQNNNRGDFNVSSGEK